METNRKIIVTPAKHAEQCIQPLLNDGWYVTSMIAENVSVSMCTTGDRAYTNERSVCGEIIFLLEKENVNY